MVKIIGHRGAAAAEPENTLRAFKHALDAGAAAVELDVQLTKDGRLAVIHDETVDRTTNGRGRVKDYTLAELKKLDAGRGERLPALEEVVELVRGRGQILVELKQPESAPAFLALCREGLLFEDLRAISFWHPVIKGLKEQEPRLRTGALMVGCPADPVGLARAAATDTLVLNYRYVNGELTEAAHRQGLKVSVWNIDDPEDLAPYLAMNLEAICTNRPAEIIQYLRGAGA
ncbi:MAG: glycerophosphodiester phosphodiesterase family protein [Syntrophales bacterium]|nr:glycerophosphodiester phosphodiesterase family protein [Syntrophales bacterium]MDD5642018.1 glycerophosphodiester phosphodiesterase family protein [Syntrophales bacterium]